MQFFNHDIVTKHIAIFDPHVHNRGLARGLPGDTVYLADDLMTVVGVKERIIHRLPAVISLNQTRIIGKNKRGTQIWQCRPLQSSYPDFYVASSLKEKLAAKSGPCMAEGFPDYYILIEFTEWTEFQRCPHANQIDVIGPIGVGDTASEERALLLKHKLWTKNYKEIPPAPHLGVDLVPRRVFGLDYGIVAVDPEGSFDYDDAFHVEVDESGAVTEVVVHIADPTAYIKEGSPLDLEIRNRWTSLYLETRRINMIPDTFANDVCSLIARKERPAISVIWKMNATLWQMDPEIVLSLITVKRNLTYEEADRSLSHLFEHFGVADSHELVEQLMIKANHAVARTLLSVGWGLIRTMKPDCSARYELNPTDIVHHGLNLEGYCHFTSPIRRYPDMLVHRLLKTYVLHQTETTLSKEELNSMCELVNVYYHRVRKMYNELAILKLSGMISSDTTTIAVVEELYLDQRTVRLRLPEFDISLNWKFCSRTAAHLMKATGGVIEIEGTDSNMDLTQGSTLKIRLFTAITPFIKKKIRIALES